MLRLTVFTTFSFPLPACSTFPLRILFRPTLTHIIGLRVWARAHINLLPVYIYVIKSVTWRVSFHNVYVYIHRIPFEFVTRRVTFFSSDAGLDLWNKIRNVCKQISSLTLKYFDYFSFFFFFLMKKTSTVREFRRHTKTPFVMRHEKPVL